jgi:hypothetical protein
MSLTSASNEHADGSSHVDFDAYAVLRKWPSLRGQPMRTGGGAVPYMVMDGTLDVCIRKFASKPASQHHLYEIHTAPQRDIVTAVLKPEHIAELVRLRDFL